MTCRCDNDETIYDENSCYDCTEPVRVKGRFGLAWVAESPECPRPEPIGWQVEFHDTPSKVEAKCQEMVRWINCPPLPRCEPCPPDELCSPNNPPRCNPCAPVTNPCHPSCMKRNGGPSRQASVSKRCCCCGATAGGGRGGTRCFPPQNSPYCRKRSTRRRPYTSEAKCTCDDMPMKDNIDSSSGDYMRDYPNHHTNSKTHYNHKSHKQVTPDDSKETVTLFRNSNKNPYNTDTDTEAYRGGRKDDGSDHDAKLVKEKVPVKEKGRGISTFTNGRSQQHTTVAYMKLDELGYPEGCRDCCDNEDALEQCLCFDDDEQHDQHQDEHEKPAHAKHDQDELDKYDQDKHDKYDQDKHDKYDQDKHDKHDQDKHNKHEQDKHEKHEQDKHEKQEVDENEEKKQHKDVDHQEENDKEHHEVKEKDTAKLEAAHYSKNRDAEPQNQPNHHKNDKRFKESQDSIEKALADMGDSNLGSFEDENLQKGHATAAQSRFSRSRKRDADKDKNRCCWWAPIIGLCFKRKDCCLLKDRPKSKSKSPSPNKKNKSP